MKGNEVALKDQLDQDIKQFFNSIDNMLPEGQALTLKLLFDKYCHLSSTPIRLDKSDFNMIKQRATRDYVDSSFPKKFNNSYQSISSEESANYCLVKATIEFLQSKDCLKKTPKFDLEGE